jgi:endonuclease IV
MKIGAHVPIDVDLGFAFNEVGLKVIQVCITPPQSYVLPRSTDSFFARYKEHTKDPLIIHSSFLTSFVKHPMEKQCIYGRDYARKIAEISSWNDMIIYYVCHLGKIPKDMTSQQAMLNLIENMNILKRDLGSITAGYNFKLCLENDVGSKGKPKTNCAHGLLIFKENFADDYEWLSLCFDTEHAYASGFSNKYWRRFLNHTSVIHFNPIPQHIEKGKHLDRHGAFLLKDSKNINVLKKVYEIGSKKKLPMILENESLELIVANMKYIKKHF